MMDVLNHKDNWSTAMAGQQIDGGGCCDGMTAANLDNELS